MYWLGPFEYRSKQALLEEIKKFLRSADLGVVVHPVANQKLHLVLLLHLDAERKIGAGVNHFLVAKNELAGRGLRIARADGTVEGFSYKKCIMGATQSPHGKVCEALRFVVRPQLDAFRASISFPAKCAISGTDIVRPNDLHIDHKIPFWRLLEQFSGARQIELSTLQTVGSGLVLALVDSSVSLAFEAFHREHAQLQPSHRLANDRKGGKLPE
ncbi:hypothetical protein D3C85_1107440 [compost metagenome]|jgi:hypothetical protein